MSDVKAEVVAVFPNKVKIVVDDLENFRIAEESLRVGSYLKIADNENAVLVAIIENFQIQARDDGSQDYVIEAFPLGVLRSEEHTSELKSLMRISYAGFCLKKKKQD